MIAILSLYVDMKREINMIKEKFTKIIEKELPRLFDITKSLYENPEIGTLEYKSSKMLVDTLKDYGFDITYPYIMETGYLAVYDSKKKGPKIGFLCEYDALPVVGHGCGHNLICTMSIAGAVALKSVIDEIGGAIYVYGTPAEENFGGKVQMAKAHAFDILDVALMIHPGTKNGLGGRSQALIPVKFKFYGKSAHASRPYNGASALDAAVTTYQGINMLRQFMKQPSFIHGIIKDGGSAANVIPEFASLEYYFRSETSSYASYLATRAKEIASSAAKMNNCTVEFEQYEEAYDDTKINYALAEGLKEAYLAVGLSDIKDVDENPSGSTDIGAVSKIVPTIQGNIKIAPPEVNCHSKELASATVTEEGRLAIKNGGLSLALLAYKYITDYDYQKKIWEEFKLEASSVSKGSI